MRKWMLAAALLMPQIVVSYPPGSGGGSPGGASGNIQYNNGSGGFGGNANANIDSSTGGLLLVAQAVPSAPASTKNLYFLRAQAAKNVLGSVNSDNVTQFMMNSSVGRQPITQFGVAGSTTAPTVLGLNANNSATLSFQFTAGSANRWTSQMRKRYTTTTTAGNATGFSSAVSPYFSGNAAGYGGVFAFFRCGHSTNTTGYQLFCGISASPAVLAGDASALLNMVGIGYDAADTSGGNWQLMHNDGSGIATRVDLGATNAARATDQGFDLYIYNPPNSTTWNVQIINVNTGVEVTNTSFSSDVPAVNTGLGWTISARNGAIAAAATVEHGTVQVESLSW